MTETLLSALRGVANRDLYRRNAFQVTGLPAGVDRRATRHRQQQLAAALEMGADLDTTGSRDPDELRAAFDRILGDPRRRLVDEVFGEWGSPGPDCGCPPDLHALHDKAVHSHAELIEWLAESATARRDPVTARKKARSARVQWQEVLARKKFWQHLRHRVLLLDDLQLAVTAVDQLREHLPTTLAGPLIDLAVSADAPRPAAGVLREWPLKQQAIDRLLESACTAQYDRLEETFDRLQQRISADPAALTAVIAELETSVEPAARRLEILLPSATNRRTASSANGTARLFNNCAVGLMAQVSVFDPRLKELLRQASRLVEDDALEETIAENERGLAAMTKTLVKLEADIGHLVAAGQSRQAKVALADLLRRSGDAAGTRDIRTLLHHLERGTWYNAAHDRFARPEEQPRTTLGPPPGGQAGALFGRWDAPDGAGGCITFLMVLLVAFLIYVLVQILK